LEVGGGGGSFLERGKKNRGKKVGEAVEGQSGHLQGDPTEEREKEKVKTLPPP